MFEKRPFKFKSLRQKILSDTKKAEYEYKQGLPAFQITSTHCTSTWLNLFLLTGNLFAFAAAIQSAKAEMNANPRVRTRETVSNFRTTTYQSHCNVSAEEIRKKEIAQLTQYKEAVADLRINLLMPSHPQRLADYNASFKTKSSDYIFSLARNNYRVKLIKVLEEDSEKFFLLEFVDPLEGWLDHILFQIDKYVSLYEKHTKEIQLIEEDTYYIQFASRKALLAFGGEDFLRLHDEHHQRCLPQEPLCLESEQEELNDDHFRLTL